MKTFKSGAVRSADALPFHSIPPQAIRRLAARYALGIDRGYPENNWRLGLDDVDFVKQLIDHLEEHWLRFKEHLDSTTDFDPMVTGDDDLAAIMWGVAALMEVQRLHPDALHQALSKSLPPLVNVIWANEDITPPKVRTKRAARSTRRHRSR